MKVVVGRGQLFEIDHARFLARTTRTRIFATLSGMRRFLLVLMMGCGGGGDDKPADAGIDAPPLCTHIQNLKLYKSRALTFGTMPGRYPGSICVDGRSDIGCATTDFSGVFEMCVPSMGDFVFSFTKEGFEHDLYLHGQDRDPLNFMYGIPDDATAGPILWQSIGGDYPPTTKGHLVPVAYRENTDGTLEGLGGAQISLVPSAGLTVVYADSMGKPDTSLTATANGLAFVANVTPGMYDIQVTAPGLMNCAVLTGGYPSPDNSQDARVPVIAGATVVFGVLCKP